MGESMTHSILFRGFQMFVSGNNGFLKLDLEGCSGGLFFDAESPYLAWLGDGEVDE